MALRLKQFPEHQVKGFFDPYAVIEGWFDADFSNQISYTRNVTDPAGITDTGVVDTFLGTLNDLAGLTDTVVFALGPVQTDTSGLTDTSPISRVIQVDDPAGSTDATKIDRGVIPTDTSGLTDAVVFVLSSNNTDPAGLTDSGLAAGLSGVTTDTSGLTDTVVIDRGILPTDTTGLVDIQVINRGSVSTDTTGNVDSIVISRSTVSTDTSGLTDTGIAAGLSGVTTDDSGLTDIATPVKSTGANNWTVTANDAAGMADAIVIGLVKNDPAGITDTGVASGLAGLQTDPAGLTDKVSINHSQVTPESAGITDTGTAIRTAGVATDVLGLSDGIIHTHTNGVVDRAGLTDAGIGFGLAGTEPTGLTDNSNVSLRAGGRFPNDAIGITDSTVTASVDDVQTDSAGLTDSITFDRSQNFYDTNGMADAGTAYGLQGSITDYGTMHDVASNRANFNESFSDDAGISDNVSVVSSFTRPSDDPLGLSDAILLSVGLYPTDREGLSDTAAAERLTNLSFTDLSTQVDTDTFFVTGTNTAAFLLTEVAGLSDVAGISVSNAITDTSGLTDYLDYTTTVTDTSGLTDSWAKGSTNVVKDDAGLTDQVLPRVSSLYDDPINVTDALGMFQIATKVDNAGVSDVFVVDHILNVTPTDRLGMADNQGYKESSTMFDTLGILDSIRVSQTKGVKESTGLTDLTRIVLKPSRLSGTWSFT